MKEEAGKPHRLEFANLNAIGSRQAEHIKVRDMGTENWYPHTPSRETSNHSAPFRSPSWRTVSAVWSDL